jgi:hypothetical protein
MFPDFLGIGAQKAGTTWLYRNFQKHLGIWMPPEKELHFFDEKLTNPHSLRAKVLGTQPRDERWRRQVRRQLNRYREEPSLGGIGWHVRYFLGRPSDGWYRTLFRPGAGRVTGEITPDYSILSREQVIAARRVNPSMRIIFIMRNPVERAWSHAAMEVGRAEGLDLEHSSERLIRHFETARPRRFGDYVATLETWSEAFPEPQIFVAFLEDVSRHPEALLDLLCDHIGAQRLERYPNAQRRVHSGDLSTIPLQLAQHLARMYLDQVRELERRFGGYASWWVYCLERLIDDPPEGRSVGYPFMDSPLFVEWQKEAGEPDWLDAPQSAPLPAVGRA